MNDVDVKQIINNAVSETVIKLKKLNLMNESKLSAYRKTEELLRNYPKWKNIEVDKNQLTKKLMKILDKELEALRDDPYYEIIPMIYFENQTREEVAEYFDVNCRTVTRNKNRLVNQLKVVLFSDDVITELFL